MLYKDKDIYKRSTDFGISIVKLVDSLSKRISTIEIGKQLVRSAISISANIAEGNSSSSKKEFTNFMNIALKSAIETEHWLKFLDKLNFKIDNILLKQSTEIIKILTAIVKKSRNQ